MSATTEEKVADVHDNEARPQQKQPIGRLFGALKHDGPPMSLEDMERGIAEGAFDHAAERSSSHIRKLMGWQRRFETRR